MYIPHGVGSPRLESYRTEPPWWCSFSFFGFVPQQQYSFEPDNLVSMVKQALQEKEGIQASVISRRRWIH